ncbi:hypothetical protein HGRIS_005041 [Hohenbuehelia grisea]|uniref:Deacetylase sirtuin-type domain-containing protein n=1 Tax=Hohenbuehelia grisea TaxID=104357 RepID=A0ABR3JEL7_9AGAR
MKTWLTLAIRQRYWLRSYLGYPPVRDALPNTTHCALAALQYASVIPRIITQNVDGLHHKAISHVWNRNQLDSGILELHGTLHRVHCKHGHDVSRNIFQDRISAANPQWHAYALELEKTGNRPRTNPDGDVVLEGVSYDDFVVPECPECLMDGLHNTNIKPHLVFFGESISQERKRRSYEDIEAGSRLLIVGSTLATYSAFRLVKHAIELQKPVLHLNIGPSRADGLPGVQKVDIASGDIIRQVTRAVLGTSAVQDNIIAELLRSGIVKRPPPDHSDEDYSTNRNTADMSSS